MTKEALAMLGSKGGEGLDQGGLKFVEGIFLVHLADRGDLSR
jgi:hypothetical protein